MEAWGAPVAIILSVAAGALAEYGGAAMECTEAHYAQLGTAGPGLRGDSPLSEWAWMGRDMPYNPVLVERFRKTAHLESPTYHCMVGGTAAAAASLSAIDFFRRSNSFSADSKLV